MPLVPGHVANLREAVEDETPQYDPKDVTIEVGADTTADLPIMNAKGDILKIEHGDGAITVSLDGRPIETAKSKAKDQEWFANLADEIDEGELNKIAEDLLEQIDQDAESRKDWIEDRASYIRMMGLKKEDPNSAEAAPMEGMSKVRHPMLLEAVLRFQANARSELLPTDGPVKIRVDQSTTSPEQDNLAESLENDMNHYLTVTATEYVPDTDRMLGLLGMGGTAFKKIYFCPIRNRPVSESIDAEDLIVPSTATDLQNSPRVTHRISMKRSVLKRMQIVGAYRKIEDLPDPEDVTKDAVQEEKANQQGVKFEWDATRRDYTIYECYCELDIPGFEHKIKGEETGLEVPYRVTIETTSRKILSIVRDYDESTAELPIRRRTFVKYTFVPGFGFYDIGLGHILGNTTTAITAAWRELLDAGMFANFPGFLYAKASARQSTNNFRVPPGGAAQIDTGGMDIRTAVMPLPYKEPSPALMQMVEAIEEKGSRLGGTAEVQVGEGRQDAPVGTTLAMIEQAQKVLNSVHKRLHAAQAEEFQLLAHCFRENPDAFWKFNKRPAFPKDEARFRQALDDYDLVPQADPNTASHMQRLMKVSALQQLASQAPGQMDLMEVGKEVLTSVGWDDPERFFNHAPPPPDPKMISAQAAMQNAATKDKEVQVKAADAQNKGDLAMRKMNQDDRTQLIDYAQHVMDRPEVGLPGHPAHPIMASLHPIIDKMLAKQRLLPDTGPDLGPEHGGSMPQMIEPGHPSLPPPPAPPMMKPGA